MSKGIQFNHPGGDTVAFKVVIAAAALEETVALDDFIKPDPADPTLYALDMSTREAWKGLDGTYSVSVTPIDDAANFGPERVLDGVTFDFLAPDPVSNLRAYP